MQMSETNDQRKERAIKTLIIALHELQQNHIIVKEFNSSVSMMTDDSKQFCFDFVIEPDWI